MTRSLTRLERSLPARPSRACRSACRRISATGARTRRSTSPRAKGARLRDIDGNEYIDYRMAYGPCILGYADPRVDAAARTRHRDRRRVRARRPSVSTRSPAASPSMVPAAELVRFSNSGTEAVMAALRARARLHRQGFVRRRRGRLPRRVRRGALVHADRGLDARRRANRTSCPYSAGIPACCARWCTPSPMNDADRLESMFKAYGHEIAAFLIEPIMGNCCSISATREFVREARALCDRYGIVMIIDEVKTGFRVARGGVQELFGVKADLCTFAKAMANGYPISVVAGREDIMRKLGQGVGAWRHVHVPFRRARGGGEDARDPRGDAALCRPSPSTALEAARRASARFSSQRGIRHSFSGHPSMSGLFFSETPPRDYRDWATSDYTFYEALAPRAARSGGALRAGFARTLVRVRGARRALPRRNAAALRDRGGSRRAKGASRSPAPAQVR